MPKRRKPNGRSAPVRLAPIDRIEVDIVTHQTGWTFARSLSFLILIGNAARKGGDTAVKNARKFFDTAAAVHDAEQKAAEKLAPKRAALRAAAALLKVSGPDTPDASGIGEVKK